MFLTKKAKAVLAVATTIMLFIALTMSVAFSSSKKVFAENTVKSLSVRADVQTGVIGIRTNEKIALGENQSVKLIYELEDLTPGSAFLDFRFNPEKSVAAEDMQAGAGEGVSLLVDPWARVRVYSSKAQIFRDAWRGDLPTNADYTGGMWVNGNATLGSTEIADGKIKVMVEIFDGGKAMISFADIGKTNWFTSMLVGWTHDGTQWSQADGFVPMDSFYPELIVRNSEKVTVRSFGYAVYDNGSVADPSAIVSEEAEGSRYTETFADSSKMRVISGSARVVSESVEEAVVYSQTMTADRLVSAGATTGISVQADPVSGIIAMQYDKEITLAEKQYLEYVVTLENVSSGSFIDFKFNPEKATDFAGMAIGGGEGGSLITDGRFAVYSEKATQWLEGWGVLCGTGAQSYGWIHPYNGDASLGTGFEGCRYSLKVRVYDDGTAIYSIARAYERNWMAFAIIGWVYNGSAWVTTDGGGYVPVRSGYPQIAIRNCTTLPVIGEMEVAVYNYGTVFSGAALADGTLVEGSSYVEDFDGESLLKAISGSMTVLNVDDKMSAVKENTTAVTQTGSTYFSVAPDPVSGIIAMQYDKEITLAEKQYLEYVVTLENVSSGSFIDFKFNPEKATDFAGMAIGGGEGGSLITDGRFAVYSEKATQWLEGWGVLCETGAQTYGWIHPYNGDASLGTGFEGCRYSLKVRVYDDGTAIYSIARAYERNWMAFAIIGWAYNGSAWVTTDGGGYVPVRSGYPQIAIRNCTTLPVIGEMEVAVYNYGTVFSGAALADGTLVEGSSYVEDFKDSNVQFVSGKADIINSNRILVNNAAADDYVVSKFTVPAATNGGVTTKLDLSVPELTGTAKAVVYFMAAENDLTDALSFTFSVNGDNRIVLTSGDEVFVTDLAFGQRFTLTLKEMADGTVSVSVDGAAAFTVGRVGNSKIAVGTVADEENAAQIALYSVEIAGVTIRKSETDFVSAPDVEDPEESGSGEPDSGESGSDEPDSGEPDSGEPESSESASDEPESFESVSSGSESEETVSGESFSEKAGSGCLAGIGAIGALFPVSFGLGLVFLRKRRE